MGINRVLLTLCIVLALEQFGAALECHKCYKELSEDDCNNSPTVTCAEGETCKMTVRRRDAGDLYTKGCYDKTCNNPGEAFCVSSDKLTCKICCDEDFCNDDASDVIDYIDYCWDNPCLNGGTCTTDGTGFTCTCQSFYDGPTCEGVTGKAPHWYDGTCGVSKYPDAGSGLPAFSRIVGGDVARPNEFPWQALLLDYRVPFDGSGYLCGAIILNRHWVLTAGHCIHPGFLTYVKFGEHLRSETEGPESTHYSYQKYVHPNYDIDGIVNDIALVRLSTPIVFGGDVTAACPPDPTETYAGGRALVSGWGNTYYQASFTSVVLKYTVMDVLENKVCEDSYDRINHNILKTMVCASDVIDGSFSSTCNGDSGGPLVTKDTCDRFHAIGIVSAGVQCGPSFPAIFTRISEYLDWIEDTIPMSDRTL